MFAGQTLGVKLCVGLQTVRSWKTFYSNRFTHLSIFLLERNTFLACLTIGVRVLGGFWYQDARSGYLCSCLDFTAPDVPMLSGVRLRKTVAPNKTLLDRHVGHQESQ